VRRLWFHNLGGSATAASPLPSHDSYPFRKLTSLVPLQTKL
jgi:hypothetical protein